MPQLTSFLIENGLPEYAVAWLFMLPIAVTLVIISRQIVGIRGFGISAPLLIGFAYTATGIQAGIIVFLAALGIGFVARWVLSDVRLLYLPKIALILTSATFGILFLTPFLPGRENLQFPEAIFAFLILILSLEQFAAVLIERGARKTAGIALETLLVSVVIFFVISWPWLKATVLAYPLFTLIVVVLLNLGLGKWTGLRFSEYVRFKDIIFK